MAKNGSFKFESNVPKVQAQLAQVTDAAMEAALQLIQDQAKALAPVATGGLRDHITHKAKRSGTKITGAVGSPDMYAIYMEFGTGEYAENGSGRKGGWSYQGPDGKWHHIKKGVKPHKFLRKAFRANRKQIEQILGMKLKNGMGGK